MTQAVGSRFAPPQSSGDRPNPGAGCRRDSALLKVRLQRPGLAPNMARSVSALPTMLCVSYHSNMAFMARVSDPALAAPGGVRSLLRTSIGLPNTELTSSAISVRFGCPLGTQFKGTAKQALFRKCHRRDLSHVAIFNPAEACLGRPRLGQDTLLKHGCPAPGEILEEHRCVEQAIFHA